MCLYSFTITPTSYTAHVDGKKYTIDTSKFPKEQAIAMAIEEIRAQVNAKPAAPAPAPPPAVVPLTQKK